MFAASQLYVSFRGASRQMFEQSQASCFPWLPAFMLSKANELPATASYYPHRHESVINILIVERFQEVHLDKKKKKTMK